MNYNRKQLIESLAAGDIKPILRESECKYFFRVFITSNPDGTTSYKLTVNGSTPRLGNGNWEEALTPDEIRYIEFCAKIERFCIFIVQ